MRPAPQFQASPAPSEEEAAAIAAALVLMLEAEAVVVAVASAKAPAPTESATVDPWVAEARGTMANRGVHDYRDKMPRDRAWRLSGRARVWGVPDVQG